MQKEQKPLGKKEKQGPFSSIILQGNSYLSNPWQ